MQDIRYQEATYKAYDEFSRVKISRVRDLDISWFRNRVFRCGVIPYVVTNNTIYFCLGRDRKSGDIADFGGGLSHKRDASPAKAAVRELQEESLNVFKFKVADVKSSLCIYNHSALIIFQKVKADVMERSSQEFERRMALRSPSTLEMDKLFWVDKEHLPVDRLYCLTQELLVPRLDMVCQIISNR